jgi:hypothetical protein
MASKFFDVLNYITYEKIPWASLTQEEIDSINPYLIHKYLSMCPDYLELVNYVQGLSLQDKEKTYKIYLSLIPKKKVWLKYIKSTTKGNSKELLSYVSRYYECSQREAKDYIKILGNTELEVILSSMGIDEKEIKKLLK